MRFSSVLSLLVLAGALAAAPAYAHEWSPSPGGAAPSYGTEMNAAEIPDGTTIEGQITAVERESGRFVLQTEHGQLTFQVPPAELTGVEVGDVVQVSFVMDEED